MSWILASAGMTDHPVIPTEPQGEQRNLLKVFGGLLLVEGIPRLRCGFARDNGRRDTLVAWQ